MKTKIMVILLAITILPTANALLMRLEASGTIVDTVPSQGDGPFGFWSATYIIDTAQADSIDSPNIGLYSVVSGSVTWDGVESDQSASTFSISNSNTSLGDSMKITSSGGSGVGIFVLVLRDSTGNLFSDDSVPTSLDLSLLDDFELDNIESTNVNIILFEEFSFFQGTVDSLSYSPVPLPAAVWLLLSALLGLLAARRY